jgi:hypothetical protein
MAEEPIESGIPIRVFSCFNSSDLLVLFHVVLAAKVIIEACIGYPPDFSN